MKVIPAGGVTSDRVIDKLNPLYAEIAGYLGILAGNEAYFATLEQSCQSLNLPADQEPPHPDGTTIQSEYFWMPGEYGFRFQHGFYANPNPGPWPSIEETYHSLKKAAEEAWHSSHDLYTIKGYGGCAAGFRSWGQSVWEPDVESMQSALYSLGDVASWLSNESNGPGLWTSTNSLDSPPDWLVNLRKDWPDTQHAAHSFYAFWDDVDDKCAHWVDAAARLTQSSAQAVKAIKDAQDHLLAVTAHLRDLAKQAVKDWQKWMQPPHYTTIEESPEGEKWKEHFADAGYVAGLIGLFPGADIVGDPAAAILGGISYLIPTTKIEDAGPEPTSTDLWNSYYTTVDKLCTDVTRVLHAVQTRPPDTAGTSGSSTGGYGFQQYLKIVEEKGRHEWAPRQVDL